MTRALRPRSSWAGRALTPPPDGQLLPVRRLVSPLRGRHSGVGGWGGGCRLARRPPAPQVNGPSAATGSAPRTPPFPARTRASPSGPAASSASPQWGRRGAVSPHWPTWLPDTPSSTTPLRPRDTPRDLGPLDPQVVEAACASQTRGPLPTRQLGRAQALAAPAPAAPPVCPSVLLPAPGSQTSLPERAPLPHTTGPNPSALPSSATPEPRPAPRAPALLTRLPP